ncbi:hypothetical protein JTB14_019770 [Gonioctena quinquepunctata]|nr:hypothetical protein JTB14_019770 [Gonioctena quinquepunctata]
MRPGPPLKELFILQSLIESRLDMGSYEAEQARLLQMLNEVDSESHTEHFDESESDAYESDHEEQQLDSSDTEQDISDNEIYETTFTNSVSYIGKDGTTRWKKHKPEPKNVKTRQENIIKRLPGTTTATRGLKEPIEIWEYFITDEMINIIVNGTNDYKQSVNKHCDSEQLAVSPLLNLGFSTDSALRDKSPHWISH